MKKFREVSTKLQPCVYSAREMSQQNSTYGHTLEPNGTCGHTLAPKHMSKAKLFPRK
jgi:hypothetical protein